MFLARFASRQRKDLLAQIQLSISPWSHNTDTGPTSHTGWGPGGAGPRCHKNGGEGVCFLVASRPGNGRICLLRSNCLSPPGHIILTPGQPVWMGSRRRGLRCHQNGGEGVCFLLASRPGNGRICLLRSNCLSPPGHIILTQGQPFWMGTRRRGPEVPSKWWRGCLLLARFASRQRKDLLAQIQLSISPWSHNTDTGPTSHTGWGPGGAGPRCHKNGGEGVCFLLASLPGNGRICLLRSNRLSLPGHIILTPGQPVWMGTGRRGPEVPSKWWRGCLFLGRFASRQRKDVLAQVQLSISPWSHNTDTGPTSLDGLPAARARGA